MVEGTFHNAETAQVTIATIARTLTISADDLRDALLSQPEPDQALNFLERLVTAMGDAAATVSGLAFSRLLTLLSHSESLARFLLRQPTLVAILDEFDLQNSIEPQVFVADALALTARCESKDTLQAALRAFKYRHLLRIALREITTRNVRATASEISALAGAAIEAAYRWHRDELIVRYGAPVTSEGDPCGFTVIGMGKLGARELNFSSDIDLIYFYETDLGESSGGLRGAISLHEFFVKLGRAIGDSISKNRADGFVFRVDLGLRPEGQYGAVANSLDAAETYYETWGHTWERAAWIKARPVAGDLELGWRLVAALTPFVYRKHLGFRAIEEISAMKQRVTKESERSQPVSGSWNLKLGQGGIREIEFFVQALQLVYGGKMPGIRERATVAALENLAFSGVIQPAEQLALHDAYLFYRLVEHQIQLDNERQWHSLPHDPQALDSLARRLGLEEGGSLTAMIDAYRLGVSAIFDSLVPGTDDHKPRYQDLLLDRDTDRAAQLAELGFVDPQRAVRLLQQLTELPTSPFHLAHRERMRELVESLLQELVASPDPDATLLYLAEFVQTLGPRMRHYEFLENHPNILRLLITLFGNSGFLSKILIRHPDRLFNLAQAGDVYHQRSEADFDGEIAEILDGADDLESRLVALRRYKNQELLAIGLADLAGKQPTLAINRSLSLLARGILKATVAIAEAEVERRSGTLPQGTALYVYGMGKLGANEMGYNSDLDLIFVYDGDATLLTGGDRPLTVHQFYTKVIQRSINFLSTMMSEGRLYAVDTRLRPSGNQGTLVTSLANFVDYHRRHASLWEQQALIKASLVYSSGADGKDLDEQIATFVYREDRPPDALPQIREMRARIERELAQEDHDFYNIKLGKGGLLDIEFLTQYLQLTHGHVDPAIQTPSTIDALRALADADVISVARSEQLRGAYLFLRQLENRLRIVHDRSVEGFATDARHLEILAKRLGYHQAGQESAGQRFEKDYRRVRDEVRDAFETLMT